MSMTSITRAATDVDLINRVMAAAHREMVYNPALAETEFGQQLLSGNLTGVNPKLMYPVAVDTEAAYESAITAGRGRPGYDTDIITDASLTSAVLAHWPGGVPEN